MGKRSKFERNPRDYYPTPEEAVLPLLDFVATRAGCQKTTFIEPCAGDGRLVRHLTKQGLSCVYACDIEPQADFIKKRDVLFFDNTPMPACDFVITNPPWGRKLLLPMIEEFRQHAPTWLLIDADFIFTKQAKQCMSFCHKIVSVGRVSWMDNGTSGMDNCIWVLFRKEVNYGHTEFYV